MEDILGDTLEAKQAKDTIKDIKEVRKNHKKTEEEALSADFYFTVICETQSEKEEILKALGIAPYERFIRAEEVKKLLNHE